MRWSMKRSWLNRGLLPTQVFTVCRAPCYLHTPILRYKVLGRHRRCHWRSRPNFGKIRRHVVVDSSSHSSATFRGVDPIPERCNAIFVYPRGENSGGGLIRQGALKFLAHAGFNVWESDGRIEAAAMASDVAWLRKFLSGFRGFVFFNGGGNLGIYPDNGEIRRLVIDAASASRGILVFPQSGIAVEPWLRNKLVTVWARDSNTLMMLKTGEIQTDLVPDAALFLDKEIPKCEQGSGTFVIRRLPGRDQEYRTYPVNLERYPSGDPTYGETLDSIIETIKPYRSIVSDRLHGSLISLMLRKRVAMLPGSYLKSKSFYLTWLCDIPGVRCVEDQSDLTAFLQADDVPQLDLQRLFLDHAQPALERFIANSENTLGRSHHKSQPKRLVAISGVRNERDVIEAFVRHTTALVDHLVIQDNGSTDGTREILASLVGEGLPMTVKYNDSLGYSQSGWMTELMQEAAQDLEAEWILPLDADEFLSANIRALLSPRSGERSRDQAIAITVRTYLPEWGPSDSSNPVLGAHRYLVHATGPWGAKAIVPAKIARKPGVVLEQGNDRVTRNSSNVESDPAGEEFFLAHFPIRSVEQYSAKIAIGWLQYLATPGRPDTWGYHWRDAFERLKSDAASFATDFDQEVWSSCFGSGSGETTEYGISEGPADYLGGELKYTPDPADHSYHFEQLLRYAEIQAHQIAQLTTKLRLAEFGTENADLPGKIDKYVANRRFGSSLILSYRHWITTARERHPFVRKIYEPLAIGILRGLGMLERRSK